MSTTDEPAEDQAIRVRLAGETEFQVVGPRPAGAEAKDGPRAKLEMRLLEALQLQHLAILAGCGASMGAGGPSMSALWDEANPPGEVLDIVDMDARGREQRDIESLLSRCDGWLALHGDDTENGRAVAEFRRKAVGDILRRCRPAGDDDAGLEAHVVLLRKLARRRVRDSRLRVFTTNYDRCFERAASRLGLVVIDGFSFSDPRRFDAKHFDMDVVQRTAGQDVPTFVPGVFQLFKLHGSVDWRVEDSLMHLGAATVVVDPAVDAERACLIYPARTKYQLSFRQPHLELMARFWSTLRGQNTCLLVAGFGFNDDHLSAPILSALHANPSLRAIVVDPGVETYLQSGTARGPWLQLAQLAQDGVDLTFVAATFQRFVELVPDLKAITPAERLERNLRSVLGSEP